jgi:FlaA1/EpsC-like NDP-sugar epimerase
MIHLSGKNETDVPIVFTGPKPGEKIHEVLWNDGEMVGPTSHPKIMRAARAVIDHDWLDESLAELDRLAEIGATTEAVNLLGAMIAEPRRTGTEAVLEDTLH